MPRLPTLSARQVMQALEHIEYLFGVSLVEANAVILDKNPAILVLGFLFIGLWAIPESAQHACLSEAGNQ